MREFIKKNNSEVADERKWVKKQKKITEKLR